MLDGFSSEHLDVNGTTIHVRTAGVGPPLLLLHGYPQSHIEWRHIAPQLAEDHTVVLADLRGYGDSAKPEGSDDHVEYAKRTMARDQVEVMETLGHDRFVLIGHDRGGRVGHRMALDHPDRVTKLVVMDIVPTHEMFETADASLAMTNYHWFFLAQKRGLPEHLLEGDPEFWVRQRLGREGRDFIEEEALAEYVRCFDAAAIHASCEDYRAAATIDLVHDEADLDVKITCPVLALWGEKSRVGARFDVVESWRRRAADVRGEAVPSGHFLAEEAPEQTLAALRRFL